MPLIPVEIEKVLELGGNFPSFYAHISKPVKRNGQNVQYAMLALFPTSGIMHLGEINPETRVFEHYDPEMRNFALYRRAPNHVVTQVNVPSEQLDRLKTLDEVLSIPSIFVKRELIPK